MKIESHDVDAIVRRVRQRFDAAERSGAPAATAMAPERPASEDLGGGIFETVDEAAEAAWQAHVDYASLGLRKRYDIVESVRNAMRKHAGDLGREAHQETGLGRAEDKLVKNMLVTERTPGPEDLEPDVVTGDQGQMLTEFAPFGVIASITPTTNPTSTIINNSIAILSAGNAVLFNFHPSAQRVSCRNVQLINAAVQEAGGPDNLVTGIAQPTIASAQEVMRHPRVRLIMVTGGPGVVREALKTDKRAVTAGPGNPPVVVDETADLELAGREIVRGASFDNNIVCVDEKEVLVVDSEADRLLQSLEANKSVILKEFELRKLERVIFKELGRPNKPGRINGKWIGKNAGRILGEIGIQAGDDVRLAVAEVPREHSLVWTEQMMPVLPVVRVRDVDDGIDLARRAEHSFRHTASIYSRDVDHITRMARVMNVSIFVANGANLAGLGAGGEGFTSFSIATPTGEGLSRPRTFSRLRRLSVVGSLRIV